MSLLSLSVAIGDYDRNRPLIDGAVKIDGVDPVFMKLVPEEIFFRAFRSQDFDICELSLSSCTLKTALGNCPYVGVPAFVSRCFRHTSIVVRRTLVEKHPWLPAAVFKAFDHSKRVALEQLTDVSATKVTMPFVEEQLKAARELMGEDFWPYGVESNRKTLEAFLRHHHGQGISPRLVAVEEMFHPATQESFKI